MIDAAWKDVRRILAVRLDNLGDVLVTTPAIHAVKRALPQASITLLASTVGAQVGRLNHDIAEVIVYSAPWMDPWRTLDQNPQREAATIETVARGEYDAAIIFTSFRQSPLPAAYLCYLAGIPLRLAGSIDGPGSLLTTRHRYPERIMHEVEHGLDLVAAVGIQAHATGLMLDLPAEARQRGAALLHEHNRSTGPAIVVHPGCTMPARTYPWEMFAEVADGLIERLDATIYLTGTAEEAELVDRIRSRMRHPAVDLAGSVSFADFCGLVASANLTITNNTGPMHVAAALQTPVIALFALTNPPEQWGPWQVPHRQLFHDVPCRICYSRICPVGHECLRLVSPSQVVRAAEDLLAETRSAETNWETHAVGAGQ